MDYIVISNEVAFVPDVAEALSSYDLDTDNVYFSEESYGHREPIPSVAPSSVEWWNCFLVEKDHYSIHLLSSQEMNNLPPKKVHSSYKVTVVDIKELLRPENVDYLKRKSEKNMGGPNSHI